MKHYSEVDVSRRQLLAFVIGGFLAGGAQALRGWLGKRGERLPSDAFINLYGTTDDGYKVAGDFVHYNTPMLMASYAVFFPSFLERWGRQGLSLIIDSAAREKSRTTVNSHRLDALPAVVSAHLLPTTLDITKEELCHEISRTLRDPRREVREIVVQNLITAASSDFDSVRFFSIDRQVLDSLDVLIEEAKSSPKLLSPLCLCTEFLLNARALLRARKAEPRLLRPTERRLQAIVDSKVPHFWYAARLAHLHQKLFPQADPHDPYSLPPQRTETLLGWRTVQRGRPNLRPYLEHLALIHTQMVFTNIQTLSGADTTARDVITPAEAVQAAPKGLSVLKHFDVRSLLPSRSEVSRLKLPIGEDRFRKFLRMDLDALLTEADLSSLEPSEEERLLASCVPFSQYKGRSIASRLALSSSDERRDVFWNLLSKSLDVVTNFIMGGASSVVFYDLIREVFYPTLERTRPTPPQPTGEDLELMKGIALEKAHEADSRLGSSLDEQEAELGPARLPRSFGDG